MLTNLIAKITDRKGAIKGGALNITLGSAIIIAMAEVVNAIPDWSKAILGQSATPAVRASLAIGFLGAWSLIVVADIVARGAAAVRVAEQSDQGGEKQVRPTLDNQKVRVATEEGDENEKGWAILDKRVKGSGAHSVDELLVIKSGKSPRWVPIESVRGD